MTNTENHTPVTTWGSRNAEGMFRIATRLAGFDAKELMLEIHRRSTNGHKVNENTVTQAMQTLSDRARAALNEKE